MMLMRRGGAVSVTYLSQFRFTDAESAPITSPHTENSASLTVTQNDGQFSISSGKLNYPGQTTPSWGDLALVGPGRSRIAGLTHAVSFLVDTTTKQGMIGWANSSGGNHTAFDEAVRFTSVIQNADFQAIGEFSAATEYKIVNIARTKGGLLYIKGGAFSEWSLLFVKYTETDATLYAKFLDYDSAGTLDNWIEATLSDPFDTDFGPAYVYDATPSANDTADGKANGITELTWTPGAGETLSIYFRRTDDDNTYRLDCAQAAGTIKLYRRVTASDTELNAGKTQTWTIGTPYRIVIQHAAGTIRTYVETTASTAKHTVTGETFNLTETGVKVAGFATGADLAVWPYTAEGAAKTVLDAINFT